MKKMMMILVLLFAMVGSSFGWNWNTSDVHIKSNASIQIFSYHVYQQDTSNFGFSFTDSKQSTGMKTFTIDPNLNDATKKALMATVISVCNNGDYINYHAFDNGDNTYIVNHIIVVK